MAQRAGAPAGAPAGARAWLRVDESWYQYPGMCFGLRQPTLAGSLQVDPPGPRQLQALEQGIADTLEADVPPTAPATSAPGRVAQLFAFAHGQLQRQCRIATSERFFAGAGEGGRVPVALPSPHTEASRRALRWTARLFQALAEGSPPPSVDAVREHLRRHAERGLNTFHIVTAADKLDVPVQWLTRAAIVLGTGRHARVMESTYTDATSAIGARLAQRKDTSARLLRQAGLPGGENMLVDSPEAAVKAAAAFGGPVVVKPADLDRGLGVAADLREPAEVRHAYEAARRLSDKVLVEKWVPGATHRLTVFGGRVIRVTRRIAGGVTGDGVADVAALVARMQQSPQLVRGRRRLDRELLSLDEEALGLLAQQGLAPGSVPAKGRHVRLRRRDNVNAGGTNENVPLDQVHPDNLALAVDAAHLLLLDFAGVDLIIDDAGRSWLGGPALICEVNSQPQMGGTSEPGIYERVLGELLGPQACVPARLLVAPAAGAARRELLDAAIREGGAVSDASGLWIGGRRATAVFPKGWDAAAALLRRHDVERATCIVDVADLHAGGFPVHRWDAIEFAAAGDFTAGERALVPAVESWVPQHVR